MSTDEYGLRLQQQKKQYQSGEEIHNLPSIFHYWSQRYLAPKVQQVFGCVGVTEFYVNAFYDLLLETNERASLVSIGSGSADLEIDICKTLLSRGIGNFSIVCLEVNEKLIELSRKAIHAAGLSDRISSRYFDVNRDTVDFRVAGFMAHHSLHHIVELERLFGMIKECLNPNGRFVSNDMIGRNGHMRWPEVLGFVEALWQVTPRQKRYNHQFERFDDQFVNFDCSSEGFEGIRAQDILPLLVAHFSFESFVATGGIIDVFIDRAYGPNFTSARAEDRAFIDFVEAVNESLIDLGLIKPTMMFGVMIKKGGAMSCRAYKHWTPEYCMRTGNGTTQNHIDG